MIDLYSGPTPNGQKVAIMLTETGLPYRVHEIDILAGDQLEPEFLAINPNNKMPAIVDPDGPGGERAVVWETGAILIYLAEKTGFGLSEDPLRRIEALKWLFFQVANQGPAAGQYAHFAFYAAERVEYGVQRFGNELNRQFRVLDERLRDREWVADEYGIADIALFPYSAAMHALMPEKRPSVASWVERMYARPAVKEGMAHLADRVRSETIAGGMKGFGDHHRSILFGEEQYRER